MPAPKPEPTARVSPRLTFAFGVFFFCSGAVALVYEILWMRRMALVFGSAAPAVAATLAAYFAGLGCGAYCLGRFGTRRWRPLRCYAALEGLIAIGALAVNPILDLSTRLFPASYVRFSDAPVAFMTVK